VYVLYILFLVCSSFHILRALARAHMVTVFWCVSTPQDSHTFSLMILDLLLSIIVNFTFRRDVYCSNHLLKNIASSCVSYIPSCSGLILSYPKAGVQNRVGVVHPTDVVGYWSYVSYCAVSSQATWPPLTVNRFFWTQLWNVASGSCYVTFTEHTNSITAVLFLPTNHVVVSASLDGTVRAYDLVRYRNFRTFTTPKPTQFVSLAADQSGEILCAGSLDGFQVQLNFPFEGLLQHLPWVCGVMWCEGLML
jgi:WD40 repeat protein